MKNVLIGTRLDHRPAKFSRRDTLAMSDGPGGCQTTRGGLTRRTALLGLATSFSIGRTTLAIGLGTDRQTTGRDHTARGARRHGRGRSLWRSRPGWTARRDSCRPGQGKRMVCSTWEASTAYIRR